MGTALFCPDCRVGVGVEHEAGCDVARCLAFGEQRLKHEMAGVRHDCGRDVWSGSWPGVAECAEFGWWAFFVPGGDPPWVPCSADHPAARPDLNRLAVAGVWDAGAARWRRRVEC